MLNLILQEISSSPMMLHPSALQAFEVLIKKMKSGEKLEKVSPINLLTSYESNICLVDLCEENPNPFDDYPDDSIAVIPIIGQMLKYGYWYNTGIDYIADLIRLADKSSNIIGTILLCNTPGGSSTSVIQLEDALRNRTKPCVGLVDGICMSGGIYALSFCDKIIASNPMCQIGNIGVYLQLINDEKYYEEFGIKFISIYPPESKFKNYAYMEALKGNDKPIIDENLTPFAIHFQNIIKSNRPKLDLSVEGIIEGKDFYAQDAVKYGLIDDISNFDGAAETVKLLHSEKQQIYSHFKNNF